MKFSIVTITYSHEHPLLLVQARSIAKYVNKDDLEEVIIINNSSDEHELKNSDFFIQAEELLCNSNIKLRILNIKDFEIADNVSQTSGWKNQQILKILVSKKVLSSYYLLLDSKNHFTRRVGSSLLFKENKAITFQWTCSELIKPWLLASAAALNYPEIDPNSWAMPTATPYLMNTQVTKDLIEHVNEPFDTFFHRDYRTSEFFIYFSYLKKLNIIDKYYHFVPQFYATFFANYPSTPQQIESIQKLAESNDVFCVGIHRDRFKNCSSEFKLYIFELWSKHNLVVDETDFNRIFNALAN